MLRLRRSRSPRQAHFFGNFTDWLEPVFHHSSRLSCIVSDYVLMTIELGGFLSIAALLIGLFAWLRQDMQAQMGTLRGEIAGLRDEITGLRGEITEIRTEISQLRERMAHLEGLLEGLREAITSRPVAQ